jgi:hypothetical protein
VDKTLRVLKIVSLDLHYIPDGNDGNPWGLSPELAAFFALLPMTLFVSIGTKNTAFSLSWTKHYAATGTLISDNSGVRLHMFLPGIPAYGTL